MSELRMVLPPASTSLEYDWSREGYRLLCNTPLVEGVELELVIPPEHWDVNALLDAAGGLEECAGQRHAERLLRSQEFIPTDWDKHDLFILGTQWEFVRQPGGKKEVWIPRLTRGASGGPWEMQRWCFQTRSGWWPRAAILKIVPSAK